jgi:DNA-binding Lrp family transcriptional regulator
MRAVAQELRMKEKTVRLQMQRLKERGLVSLRPLIDVYRLGLVQWGVFFSIASGAHDAPSEILRYLVGREDISFVCELGGEYHFEVTVCAAGPSEAASFVEELGMRLPEGTIHKAVAARLALFDFRIKYLFGASGTPQILSWGHSSGAISIDELDHHILRALSRGEFTSASELGRRYGVSHTAVSNRIARLERERVIVGYRYLLDTFALGYQSHLVLMFAQSMGGSFRKRLLDFCRDHLLVRFLVHNFGAWEYECGIEVSESQQVSEFTRELGNVFAKELGTFRVAPIFRYPKVVNYPFERYETVAKLLRSQDSG